MRSADEGEPIGWHGTGTRVFEAPRTCRTDDMSNFAPSSPARAKMKWCQCTEREKIGIVRIHRRTTLSARDDTPGAERYCIASPAAC